VKDFYFDQTYLHWNKMGDLEFKGTFDVVWKKGIKGNEERGVEVFHHEQYRYKTI
jgi:hypothetical protein